MRIQLVHDRRLESGRGLHRLDGESEQHRGVRQLRDLVAGGLGLLKVSLEFGEVSGIQPIEGVGAGQVAEFLVARHDATPISSRRRIIPSRIRVLIVPIGTLRISATSLLL